MRKHIKLILTTIIVILLVFSNLSFNCFFEECRSGSKAYATDDVPLNSEEDIDMSDFTYTAKFKSAITNKVSSFEFLYDDSFFNNISTNGVIPGLASASIYLASSAYYKYTDSEGVSRAGITDLLGNMGYNNICTYNYGIDSDITDVSPATKENCNYVAYTFGSKSYVSENGEESTIISVVVRGTPGSPEWYGNFNIGSEGVYHQGFVSAASDVISSLNDYMSTIEFDPKTTKFWITGHSRGAAVANLVATSLNANETYAKQDNIYAYTYACPTVATTANVNYKNIYNFCNNGDLIAFLPLDSWGFKRSGESVYFNLYGKEKEIFNILTGKEYSGIPGVTYLTDCFYNVAENVQQVYEYNVDDLLMIVSAYLCDDMSLVEATEALNALLSVAGDWTDYVSLITGFVTYLNDYENFIHYGHCQEAYISYANAQYDKAKISSEIALANNLTVLDKNISDILVDKDVLYLIAGETENVNYSAEPNINTKYVLTNSSNSSVATISGNTITAVGSGKAYIYFYSEDYKVIKKVEVNVYGSSNRTKLSGTIDKDTTVYGIVEASNLTVSPGVTLTVYGKLEGSCTNRGTVYINGSLYLYGTSFNNYGILTVTKTVTVEGQAYMMGSPKVSYFKNFGFAEIGSFISTANWVSNKTSYFVMNGENSEMIVNGSFSISSQSNCTFSSGSLTIKGSVSGLNAGAEATVILAGSQQQSLTDSYIYGTCYVNNKGGVSSDDTFVYGAFNLNDNPISGRLLFCGTAFFDDSNYFDAAIFYTYKVTEDLKIVGNCKSVSLTVDAGATFEIDGSLIGGATINTGGKLVVSDDLSLRTDEWACYTSYVVYTSGSLTNNGTLIVGGKLYMYGLAPLMGSTHKSNLYNHGYISTGEFECDASGYGDAITVNMSGNSSVFEILNKAEFSTYRTKNNFISGTFVLKGSVSGLVTPSSCTTVFDGNSTQNISSCTFNGPCVVNNKAGISGTASVYNKFAINDNYSTAHLDIYNSAILDNSSYAGVTLDFQGYVIDKDVTFNAICCGSVTIKKSVVAKFASGMTQGYINNNGKLTIEGNSRFTGTNNGELIVNGDYNLSSEDRFYNNGTMFVTGKIYMYGTGSSDKYRPAIYNNGLLSSYKIQSANYGSNIYMSRDDSIFNVCINAGSTPKLNITAGTFQYKHTADASYTVETEQTCSSFGEASYYCCICNAFVEKGIISAHFPDVIVKENVVEPTFTSDGSYEKVTFCSKCNVELSRQVIATPMLDPYDILSFEIFGNEAHIVSCLTSAKGELSIPSSYRTYKVTKICESAFLNCNGISEVVIPNDVCTIDDNAFYGCSSLKVVRMGINVKNIGKSAFDGCDLLPSGDSKFKAERGIYYFGTADNFSQIEKETPNKTLNNAKITFAYSCKEYSNEEAGTTSNVFDGYSVAMTEHIVPGIYDNMIPQGLAYYEDKNWFLISAYHKTDGNKNPGVIYAIDATSGEFVAQFNLYNVGGTVCTAHLGGIAVSDNNVYVTYYYNQLAYFPLSELNVSTGTIKDIKLYDSMEVSALAEGRSLNEVTEKEQNGAAAKTAYVEFSDGVLWTGNFYCSTIGSGLLEPSYQYRATPNNNSIIVGYKLDGIDSSKEWNALKNMLKENYRIKLANDVHSLQGATINNNKLYISVTTNSSFTAEVWSSDLKFNGNEVVLAKKDFTYKGKNIDGAEEIIVVNDYLYSVYESAALVNTGSFGWSDGLKSTTGVMCKVKISDLKKKTWNVFNCPINIDVIDTATGEVVCRIVDNKIDEEIAYSENAVLAEIIGETKYIYTPVDKNYEFHITGNGNGKMDYTIISFDDYHNEKERINFFDIEINEDSVFTGNLNLAESEFQLPNYKLVGDTPIDLSEHIAESKTMYNVELIATDGGFVTDSMTCISGDTIEVIATSDNGYVFDGWYESGVLISKDRVYRTVVRKDLDLTAQFVDYWECRHYDGNEDNICDECEKNLCTCICHQNGIFGIVWRIFVIIFKTFKANATCSCGTSHY